MNNIILFLFFFLLLLPGHIQGQEAPPTESENKMVLTQRSMVIVTVNNVITNTCDGTAGLQSPETRELFPAYNALRGESVTLGPYEAGTELIFSLSPSSYCSGYTYLSTNPLHAHVTPLDAPNSWRIDWEDLPDDFPPDNDFNDLILVARAVGSIPDFKQDRPDDQGGWENDPYDNIQSTIGQVGCATTSSADLLNYYGAADINPQTLDDCLSRDDVRGYVRWEEDPDCIKGDMKKCDAGAIKWRRIGWCSNPDNPYQEPYLMRYIGKTNIGGLIRDPDTGEQRGATRDDLERLADKDLENGWPVIFEVSHPDSPSGIHFVAGTGRQDETFQINDPLCGDWPDCPLSQDILDDFGDSLNAIVQFAPNDGVNRPTLNLGAFSPVEFYVTDPLGRRTGYLPDGTYLAEIPDANYYFQPPIADDQTSQAMGDGFKEFYVINAVPGDYTVTVTGVGDGEFALLAEYDAAPLTVYTSLQTGSVKTGSGLVYTVRVSPDTPPEWHLEESTNPPPVETQPAVILPTSGFILDTPTPGSIISITPVVPITLPVVSTLSPQNGAGILVIFLVIMGGGVAIYAISRRPAAGKARQLPGIVGASLVGLSGTYAGGTIHLPVSGVVIGRDAACNLRLTDQRVSRQHARLRYAQGRWFIQDVGSSGGTFVNNQRIGATMLHSGDRIRIGTTEFEFRH